MVDMFECGVIECHIKFMVKLARKDLLQIQEYLIGEALDATGFALEVSERIAIDIGKIIAIVSPFFILVSPATHIYCVAREQVGELA